MHSDSDSIGRHIDICLVAGDTSDDMLIAVAAVTVGY